MHGSPSVVKHFLYEQRAGKLSEQLSLKETSINPDGVSLAHPSEFCKLEFISSFQLTDCPLKSVIVQLMGSSFNGIHSISFKGLVRPNQRDEFLKRDTTVTTQAFKKYWFMKLHVITDGVNNFWI